MISLTLGRANVIPLRPTDLTCQAQLYSTFAEDNDNAGHELLTYDSTGKIRESQAAVQLEIR